MKMPLAFLVVPLAGASFFQCRPLRDERSVLEVAARVTLSVYVFVVLPSRAVTTVVMVLEPTARLMDPQAVPDGTSTPLTFTVALGSAALGVTVRAVVVFETLAE